MTSRSEPSLTLTLSQRARGKTSAATTSRSEFSLTLTLSQKARGKTSAIPTSRSKPSLTLTLSQRARGKTSAATTFRSESSLTLTLSQRARGKRRRPRRPDLKKVKRQFYFLTLTLSQRAREKTSVVQTSRFEKSKTSILFPHPDPLPKGEGNCTSETVGKKFLRIRKYSDRNGTNEIIRYNNCRSIIPQPVNLYSLFLSNYRKGSKSIN